MADFLPQEEGAGSGYINVSNLLTKAFIERRASIFFIFVVH